MPGTWTLSARIEEYNELSVGMTQYYRSTTRRFILQRRLVRIRKARTENFRTLVSLI